MKNDNYQVLLYYKYVNIKSPEGFMKAHKRLCEKLNLTGRIIISHEGINGTVEGTVFETEKYIKELTDDPRFSDINFKKSVGTGGAFPRLSVKVRPELVTSGVSSLDPNKVTGKYITATELFNLFESKQEFYVVDMRNNYEYISGQFEGSLLSGFSNFKDLPAVLEKVNHLKNKTIVTVCTGGVRCEKASGFLVESGFENVYQLKDGIQTFMEMFPNTYYKGKLYVFDNRLTIGFNTEDRSHQIIGRCEHCGVSCDTYVNCEEPACHKHYICCDDCLDKDTNLAFCDKHCKELFFKKETLSI